MFDNPIIKGLIKGLFKDIKSAGIERIAYEFKIDNDDFDLTHVIFIIGQDQTRLNYQDFQTFLEKKKKEAKNLKKQ